MGRRSDALGGSGRPASLLARAPSWRRRGQSRRARRPGDAAPGPAEASARRGQPRARPGSRSAADAASLAGTLRLAGRNAAAEGRGRTVAVPAVVPRLVPVALAGVRPLDRVGAPFFPTGWPFALAALAAGTAFLRPRWGSRLRLQYPSCRSATLRSARRPLRALGRLPSRGCGASRSGACSSRSAPARAARGARPLPARRSLAPLARPAGGPGRGVCSLPGSWPDCAGRRSPSTVLLRRTSAIAASGDPFTVSAALWAALSPSPRLRWRPSCWPPSRSCSLSPAAGLWAIAALGAGFLAAALLLAPGGGARRSW